MQSLNASNADASDLVRREWLNRVEAEYRSAAYTQELTLWLTQIGASPDLIRAGLRVSRDEIVHAELAHRTYTEAGGEDGPTLPRETLRLRRNENEPVEWDVTRVCVDGYCLGETVAVALFQKLRAGCTVAGPRRVLDRILRDEVRHRDFGWALLHWLLTLPTADDLRRIVERELPVYFGRLRRAYGKSREPRKTEASFEDADRAWGLMPTSEYAEALERTVTRDWIPRFRELDFDAESAWKRSASVT